MTRYERAIKDVEDYTMKPQNDNDDIRTKTAERTQKCLSDVKEIVKHKYQTGFDGMCHQWFADYAIDDTLIIDLLNAALPKRVDDTQEPQNWKQLAQAAIHALGTHAMDHDPKERLDAFGKLARRAFLIENPGMTILPEKKTTAS